MTTYISKETVNRLVKDIKQIKENPLHDNGIYYCHDDNNILKGYALIIWYQKIHRIIMDIIYFQ